ncbi:serine/threonine-protein phosphatase 4 regulatory subunit 2-like isoform X2 [Juglans microcarpa x Juglans regia]|uniref:serine/threonine-protein phosphatase 4 regulatory subunit 2-like isoform X2 n=2 Tax=Juglans microcarpa x Juglans regia TaxID=2249226 RepID=UPI001B7F0A09|nr:serine/threonine-protein phosphatase 4 regulatory subunit 2-like isoform X2 [Juglans microcarpa x Juglans regia]
MFIMSSRWWMVLMETPADENSQNLTTAANEAVHEQDNTVPAAINHGGTELEPEAEPEIAEEEVKGILEVIASTGKFWHAWYKLKSMLSFQLKQVLLEYPESKMTSEQQNASLGETYPELVKRLDEALVSFVEGPPFTLQRLCEILLEARSVYPNISKLALALEKNLLVTTMLTISTDPYPQATMQKTDEPEKAREEPEAQPNSAQNGVEPVAGDRDEVMTDVEEADIDDEMTIDMEAFEEIVGSAETKAEPTANS